MVFPGKARPSGVTSDTGWLRERMGLRRAVGVVRLLCSPRGSRLELGLGRRSLQRTRQEVITSASARPRTVSVANLLCFSSNFKNVPLLLLADIQSRPDLPQRWGLSCSWFATFSQASLWDTSRKFLGVCPSRSSPLKSRCFRIVCLPWRRTEKR